jgi:hypothetical protein
MKSPFPGMNPWLEGYLWPDVHNHLARVFAELLAPKIAPKYVARIDIATIMDNDPASEIGITYPDVEISQQKNFLQEPQVMYSSRSIASEPTFTIPYKLPIEVRVPIVEIRDAAQNTLVTAIEILSPVNKRNPNLLKYREKIDELHNRGVHVLEIDLLRRGTRPFRSHKTTSHYQMMLLRAKMNRADIWAVHVQDVLPVLPVPLLAPDADVPLDLSKAMELIFERSFYHLSINYNEKPAPPVFAEGDWHWIERVITDAKALE